ncbi:hypothetical protein Acr_15g0004500 [Actinidia rufa]|uniref:Uncharacterized protein n=1 Tax=Actinidia rufa TaxID=165716 RepID=A0A7J0FT30_9ERIC|nr:hypothetical protein Acr_15g0004500 [Actinidia rufa]
MMIFFNIRKGHSTTSQWTTGRHRRKNPLRLFPSLTVLPFRRLSRRRVRHHPTTTVELLKREIVIPPLLSIANLLDFELDFGVFVYFLLGCYIVWHCAL